MSPNPYSQPNRATSQLSLGPGADWELQRCTRCGQPLFDGAKCRCRQRRRPLMDTYLLDGEWTGLQLERIARRGTRGELIA